MILGKEKRYIFLLDIYNFVLVFNNMTNNYCLTI